MRANNNAGTSILPSAAKIGRDACLKEDNSPSTTSLLISKLTYRKKCH